MTGWKLTPREPTKDMLDASQGMNWFLAGSDKSPEEIDAAFWSATHEAAPAPTEDVLERMARAFLTKLYGVYPDDHWAAVHAAASVKAMRAALSAAEDRGEQASTSPPSEGPR